MISVALLPQGSTSDEAAQYLFGETEVDYRYYKPIADVFLSTAGGKTDYSVIPIENTIEGSVSLHVDWLVHEVELPIQAEWVYPSLQNLIGHRSELQGADGSLVGERIVKVLSHPVALAQCSQFLRTFLPHVELEQVSSTVEAVRLVKDNPGAGWAAIGTRSGARLHELDIVRESVTDHSNNYTRFLLVGSKPFEARSSDKRKTSILVSLNEDYPGALHQVLSAFSWRRINLSKIESRPTKKRLGNYYFYIDIEMPVEAVLLQSAFSEIEAIGHQIRILGSYPSFSYR
ncbi:prephenate dehydratase [Paenibacillus sp. SYP-B4298]|uniref:prephenate dehydratase n=1 Tax=Paenibacillus sp. SYP-B4298 TaxID=2996034 RepID=UPI0022DE0F02|nr:prephenate dehydratase [Paenibacillus sp. SYP-B4298]